LILYEGKTNNIIDVVEKRRNKASNQKQSFLSNF
jgi:hypothetical protein